MWVKKKAYCFSGMFGQRGLFSSGHIKRCILYLLCQSRRLLNCSEIKVASPEAWLPDCAAGGYGNCTEHEVSRPFPLIYALHFGRKDLELLKNISGILLLLLLLLPPSHGQERDVGHPDGLRKRLRGKTTTLKPPRKFLPKRITDDPC